MRRAVLLLMLLALLPAGQTALARSGRDSCVPRAPLAPSMYQVLKSAQEMMAKNPAGAAKLLARYAQRHKGQRHYHFSFMRGVLAHQNHDLGGAESHFAQAVKLRPCFTQALANLAVVKYERKAPLRAAELMLKAAASSSKPRPDYLYQAAVFYLAAGQPRKALPILVDLAKRPQARQSWLKALVQTYMELKQPGQARLVLERLLRKSPGQAGLWKLSARLNLDQKRYAAAAADLEIAYRLEPPSHGGWRNLAALYRLAGAPQKAAGYYLRSFGNKPRPKDLDLLAAVYLEGNRREQALETATRAITLAPSSKRWRFVAQVLFEDKKYNQALAAFRQAVRLAPREARTYLMAGYCALQVQDYRKALAYLGQAAQKAGKDGSTYREANRVIHSIKDFLKATDGKQKG